MAYTITLSDEEYETLAAEAQRTGESVEALVHAAVRARYAPAEATRPTGHRMNSQEFLEHLYRTGVVANIPPRPVLTEDERAERDRLARSIAPGTPLSDIVIEERGPR